MILRPGWPWAAGPCTTRGAIGTDQFRAVGGCWGDGDVAFGRLPESAAVSGEDGT
jgi:hypothetical protein